MNTSFFNGIVPMDLKRKQVEKGTDALLQIVKRDVKNKDLLLVASNEGERINLMFSFKKAPTDKKTIKIDLPHSLSTSTTDVCLFVKDDDKKDRDFETTVRRYKELLASKKVTGITQVIPLKQLKLEYLPNEAKKNLSNQFDTYLADERIVRLLSFHLGKNFFKRKRQPMQVNVLASDLKKEINRALNSTRCFLQGRGSSSMVTVGHTEMTSLQLTDNIMTTVAKLGETIPGGANNIRNLNIKTDDSIAVPVYVSEGPASEIILQKRERKVEEVIAEDVTTVTKGKVKVDRYGKIEVVGKRDRSKRKLEKQQKAKAQNDDQLQKEEESSNDSEPEELQVKKRKFCKDDKIVVEKSKSKSAGKNKVISQKRARNKNHE